MSESTTQRAGLGRRVPRRLAVVALVGTAVAAAVLAITWYASGGRWYNVQTPSMGRAAPVGTLLITRPVDLAHVHVGDMITFRTPTSREVYSHRVIAKTATGISTRGDNNPVNDPWTLTGQNLIGRVVMRWWGVGWVLRAVPLVLIGLALVWLLSSLFSLAWRSPARVVGTAVVFSLVAFWLKPWVGLVKLGQTGSGRDVAVQAVSTGVLPIKVADRHGGSAIRLVNGEIGSVPVTHHTAGGQYGVSTSLALTFWWWVGVVIVCLLPLLWTLAFGLVPGFPPPANDVLAANQPFPTDPRQERAQRRPASHRRTRTEDASDLVPGWENS